MINLGLWTEEMLLEISEDGVIFKPRVSFFEIWSKRWGVGSLWRQFIGKALHSKKYYQHSQVRPCIANHSAAPYVTANIT